MPAPGRAATTGRDPQMNPHRTVRWNLEISLLTTTTMPSRAAALAATLPATITRSRLAELSGLSVGTLANLASAGAGPKYTRPNGGRVLYLRDDVAR